MFEMGLTIQSTFSKPNIRSVFKGETAQIGFSVVNVLVTRFINSFGFSTKLDPMQIEMITVDTLENFAYESIEDILLFFKMARSGKFGTTKRGDKLDTKKVEVYVDKITKDMDRQLLEDTILDWEKDPIKKKHIHILKAKRKTV